MDIDYSKLKPTTSQTTATWRKAPKHVYFGPKDENGEMLPEPELNTPYPAFLYAKIGDKIEVKRVEDAAEREALGKEWVDSPAVFGIITAPSFEQLQEMKAKKK